MVAALVKAELPASLTEGLSEGRLGLLVNDVKNLATGNIVSGEPVPGDPGGGRPLCPACNGLPGSPSGAWSSPWPAAVMALALKRIGPQLRARNGVEGTLMVMLIVCSSIAILTTLGIVLSVLFESLRFFQQVPWTDFLFGTELEPPDGPSRRSGRLDRVPSGPCPCSPAPC